MATTPHQSDPAMAPPMTQEADIGSGEKTPGQLETDKMITSIPALPPDGERGEDSKHSGKDGKTAA